MLGRGAWTGELFPEEQRPRAHTGEESAHGPPLKVARTHSWTPHGSLGPWLQAQSPAPPCPALSSALLSRTPWQASLGESKASSLQSRVLHSVLTKDITSLRILSVSASTRVLGSPKSPQLPRVHSDVPPLITEWSLLGPPSPYPLECTQRRSPRKHPKAPSVGRPPAWRSPRLLRTLGVSPAQKGLIIPPGPPPPEPPPPGTPPHLTMPYAPSPM